MMAFVLIFAGLSGLLGTIADTVGAHVLPAYLSQTSDLQHVLSVWSTAARYQITHALLLCIFGGLMLYTQAFLKNRMAYFAAVMGAVLSVFGSLVFCVSLYTRVLADSPQVGRFAPIGGMSLMLSWVMLFLVGVLIVCRVCKHRLT